MSNQPLTPQHLADHLFRYEAGKMIAVLTRLFGMHNLGMAEDVVQEAFLKAMQTWSYENIPDNPAGWLMQTARNKAIDIIRRQRNFDRHSRQLGQQVAQEADELVEQFFRSMRLPTASCK